MLFKVFLLPSLIVSGAWAFGDDLARQNRQKIIAMQRIIMEQNERIDGLTSLIEGLNASLAELKMAKQHTSSSDTNGETVKLIQDLGKMIDEINKNYVRKADLERILASGKTSSSKGQKSISSSVPKDDLSHTAPAKLYSEGVRLFVKKRYEEAKKRFLITARKGYKPAASNYYLGEIAYYTKQYEDAIFYYKKSAGLYDGASYMNVLLLHTAVSLDKTGDKEQAKLFYENVIENYPDKKSAAIAKKRLKGM